MSELAFVDEITRGFCPNSYVKLGPGDDTAVYSPNRDRQALITTDMLMEGTHFRLGPGLGQASPEAIGRKALAVNLSDIAAMAGQPRLAVLSLAIPQHFELPYIRRLYQGVEQLAQEYGLAVVGGDTNAWTGPLVINITVVGEALPKGPLLRSQGKVGDAILVTGHLGASLTSGKHLSFTPRVNEALYLHQNYGLHAMMDISDGLATDLRRLCKASQVGAHLHPQAIPLSPELRGDDDGLKRAMTDGEDFELLFTMPPLEAERLLAEQPFAHCPIHKIGHLSQVDGLYWVKGEGEAPEPLDWAAYEHSFG